MAVTPKLTLWPQYWPPWPQNIYSILPDPRKVSVPGFKLITLKQLVALKRQGPKGKLYTRYEVDSCKTLSYCVETDVSSDRRTVTDGQRHNIIRPILRWAYNKYNQKNSTAIYWGFRVSRQLGLSEEIWGFSSQLVAGIFSWHIKIETSTLQYFILLAKLNDMNRKLNDNNRLLFE